MPKTFFAVRWPYGVGATWIETGKQAREVLAFDTRAERDAWVRANEHAAPLSARHVLPAERRRINANPSAWPTVEA
jgi:hypothetical protein